MSSSPADSSFDSEDAVRARYSAASREVEAQLCCPVDYDPRFLEVIPSEVLERDYGCGDPTRHLRRGDRVLDLGSGGGKVCFIAAQIVGHTGHVIGVDMNEDMLALARSAAPVVAARLGYENVAFRRGRIQDLKLDLDALEAWLRAHPVRDPRSLRDFEAERETLACEAPLVADGSVDVVVSNCVLNLVRQEDKDQLFREVFRVLGEGGRLAISDIVSDAPVPERLRADAALWSGCISGAFQDVVLLRALEESGFQAIRLEESAAEPFAEVEGIVFRSVTVSARKGGAGGSVSSEGGCCR